MEMFFNEHEQSTPVVSPHPLSLPVSIQVEEKL
jgi:hypothetical protein